MPTSPAARDSLVKWAAVKSPWLQYIDSEGTHFCQPDLLLTNKNLILLCEIKLTHTSAAFFQMEKLYRPVLQRIFPQHKILSVEITRSFDPSIRFPQEMLLYFSIEDLLLNSTPSSNLNTISVLQWKL